MSARGPLWPPAFSPSGHWNSVSVHEIRECLREWFTTWGMPDALRVDNGFPWGSKGELPPDLALWLIGLEIRMLWNPPRRPQKNGVVERSQGTGKRWGEPRRCRTMKELQKRMDEMDAIHRNEYPFRKGRSRMAMHPALKHSDRPYTRRDEGKHWDWNRVAEHLAGYVTPRKVDSRGQVTIYKRNYYVGTNYSGQMVHSSFDPNGCEWIFRDLAGNELRSKHAPELSKQTILKLQVTKRRGQT